MRKLIVFFLSQLVMVLQRLRQQYYRSRLNCPPDVQFLGRFKYYGPRKITIGRRVTINDGVFLNIGNSLKIEDDVTISANVFITDTTLDDTVLPKKVHVRKPVRIKKNAWIGAGAIILPGITVGENCVISAGAVLLQSTGDNEVWVGNPARKLRNLL